MPKVISKYFYFLFFICGTVLFFASSKAYSASYQIFSNLAYENPALLSFIEKDQVILGTTVINSQFNYKGTDGPFTGSANSDNTHLLPYGRLAWRFTPSLVAGLDVTHPAFLSIEYPEDSIVQFSSVNTKVLDTDYSPKVSYQLTPRLAVGAGFDANNISSLELNFSVPPYGKATNQGSIWGYGWDTGLSYMVRRGTIFNLSYYSDIDSDNISGKSTWGPYTTADKLNGVLPATYTANCIQFLSPNWLLNGTFRYIQWRKVKNLIITNSAVGGGTNFIIPVNYSDGWSGQLATRYQLNQKLAFEALAEYDSNPQPIQYRTVALPADDVWILGGGAEYAFTKNVSLRLSYGYGFSHPKLDTTGAIGKIVGREDVNFNVADLSLKLTI